MVLQYAITDGTARLPAGAIDSPLSAETAARVALCTRLACQGVNFLLVREKHLSAAALVALTRVIVQAIGSAAPDAPTRVLVPGRADVALAAGAHGIHLSSGSGELTPIQIRVLLPEAIVSVSCHTLEEVRRARDQQATLALFAPVFGKSLDGTEVTPAAGLDALQAACHAAQPMPVYALGGITPANAPQCLIAGAAGIAGIRVFFSPPDLRTNRPPSSLPSKRAFLFES